GGTTAQRPASPTANQQYADSDRQRHVSYIGGAWREPVRWVAVPATATSAGKAGDLAADESYLYICQPDNAWRRMPLAAW
ncbi:MAG: hypothetical protein J2O44_04585, partial [Porphyrobacter sp.]|nr:hypothetical protein [Porphyrobacter sp.]